MNRDTYFGFRVGPAFTTVNSDNPYRDGGKMKTGLNVGVAAGFALTDRAPLFLESGIYYVEKGGKKLTAKAGRGVFVALLLFVGIPLPGTGAWTGTLAASFLDFGFKKSTVAVLLGVLLAGIIMTVGSLLAVMGVTSVFNFFG